MSANSPTPFLPTTRREFLGLSAQGLGLLAFSQFAPQFLVRSTLAQTPRPETDRPILVLVQLAGGNDGLNTVVPFADPNYHRLRPNLALPREGLLRVTDSVALHPALAPMHELLQTGRLAVVQNVGYPNPNRSHFRSAEIWETASDSGDFASTGWIGRYLDSCCPGSDSAGHDPLAVHITDSAPQAFAGARAHPTFGLPPRRGGRRGADRRREALEQFAAVPGPADNPNANFLRQTYMDTLVTERKVQRIIDDFRPEASFPGSAFGTSLRNVSALIAARLPTRVYFVSLSGFDTHANQLQQHAGLLAQLAEGLAAFQRDLESRGLANQVVTMTFSEFGRRPSENESKGTDHGTAAPLFLMGSRLRPGLHGTPPSLDLAPNQDLTHSTDFRQVYTSVLQAWMQADPAPVLGNQFAPLPLFG